MEIQIRGHEIEITTDMRQYIERRTSRLDRLVDRIVDAKLELRRRHQRVGGDVTIAQLTIQTGRHVLRAEEHDRDPHLAVDQAVDKLERQVRRFHEKRADRKGPRANHLELEPETIGDRLDSDSDEDGDGATNGAGAIVRTKRFSLKPMDVDEAIEHLDLLGHDFYLFHNAAEDQINLIYRRRDGQFGLLAPDRQ